jgi:hypothetical protein
MVDQRHKIADNQKNPTGMDAEIPANEPDRYSAWRQLGLLQPIYNPEPRPLNPGDVVYVCAGGRLTAITMPNTNQQLERQQHEGQLNQVKP